MINAEKCGIPQKRYACMFVAMMEDVGQGHCFATQTSPSQLQNK